MSIRSVLSFLAALVLGAGAACDAGPPSGAPEHLRVGQMLLVRLTASPATGYAWTFVGPLPPALRMERDPAPVPADRARPGAPAVQSWAFRAAQPGRVRLRFVCRRAWEPDDTALERREIEVLVR